MDPIKYIHDSTNLAMHYQFALGFSMPPVLPFKNLVKINSGINPPAQLEQRMPDSGSEAYITPLKFRLDTEPTTGGFLLPTDPLVSLSCKNIIVRRNVAKSAAAGSIKERWSRDDWDVTITGILLRDNKESLESDIKNLLRYCEAKTSVDITCPPLNAWYNIKRIAIESFDFPFTKGNYNQAFVIKAFSDDVYELLIEQEL